jgi:hypothetical protein
MQAYVNFNLSVSSVHSRNEVAGPAAEPIGQCCPHVRAVRQVAECRGAQLVYNAEDLQQQHAPGALR